MRNFVCETAQESYDNINQTKRSAIKLGRFATMQVTC